MEVALLLFALKLAEPNCVHLNRGNHECRRLNERYSFEVPQLLSKTSFRISAKFPFATLQEEVRRKYNPEMFEALQEVFCLLPLATIVEKKIFITHGGLFRQEGVTLHLLQKCSLQS